MDDSEDKKQILDKALPTPNKKRQMLSEEAAKPKPTRIKRRRASLQQRVAVVQKTAVVQDNIQLVPELRQTTLPLAEHIVSQIEEDVSQKLGASNPLLQIFVKLKLVRNERRNFLNLRLHKQYVPLAHFCTGATGTHCFFFVSTVIEPFLRLVCVQKGQRELHGWSVLRLEELNAAISSLKARFGLAEEMMRFSCRKLGGMNGKQVERSYREFTSIVELKDALGFTKECNTDMYIRIPLELYSKLMPILGVVRSEQTRAYLASTAQKQPIDCHKSLVKLSKYFRFLTERLRPEFRLQFLSTIFLHPISEVLYEFHLSDKFEPYVIIIVIHEERGKLKRLSQDQLVGLENAIEKFKARFGIQNEGYHYTSYAERMKTDSFVKRGGASFKSKAHSTDFHLKMRISTRMYLDLLPIFKILGYETLRKTIEPILYNSSRRTRVWRDIKHVLCAELELFESK